MIIYFKGSKVWNAFKNESGNHCVQRIPPTESKGRKQTSYLSVAVLPLPPKNVAISLPQNELEISFVNAGGPGGQHQNKTESAVRMKHIPTGIQVFINGRDQHANKRDALSILSAKVNEHYAQQTKAEYNAHKKNQMGSKSRGSKVRTYNFIKSRVVDHQSGKKTSNIKAVMKGDFSEIL